MARTSKTKIGGEDTAALSDRTNAASARGHAAVQQAKSESIAQQRGDQDMALRTASELSSIDDRRKQMEHQRKVDTGNQAINQQQVDLESAKSGYQRSGSAPTSPLLDEQAAAKNPRQQKLEQEMARGEAQTSAMQGPPTAEQQRQQEQNKKPMEMTGPSFVPSEQGQQMQQRKNFEADTERMRAESYQQQVRGSVISARAKGDIATENKLKDRSMQFIKSDEKLMSEVANGRMTDDSWEKLEVMASGNQEPELQSEIASRVPGPRLRSFLRGKIAASTLKYISTFGDTPDVDYANPILQQFVNTVKDTADFIGTLGSEFGQFLNIKTPEEKRRLQNEIAARRVMNGGGAQASPTGSPMGGMMPSAGHPQQGQQQGQQQPSAADQMMTQRKAGASGIKWNAGGVH